MSGTKDTTLGNSHTRVNANYNSECQRPKDNLTELNT